MARALQRDHRHDRGPQRVVDVHNDDSLVAGDIRVVARGDDEGGAIEDAIGIERDGALEKIIARVAIQQCGGVDQDEALLRVGDIEVRVERMYGLLFVLGIALPCRVHAERCG